MNYTERSFLLSFLLQLHDLRCITIVTFWGVLGHFLFFSTNVTALLVLLYEYVLLVHWSCLVMTLKVARSECLLGYMFKMEEPGGG